MPSSWQWWLQSDAGLLARVLIGMAIFTAFAVVDLCRHGRQAHRWREYLFLLVAVAAAMAYGVLNDVLTSSISWEYFYFGKGLDETLGQQVPPNMPALRWQAALVGLKATWTAGLIIGVALLIANNPRRNRPQLPYRSLYRLLPLVILATAAFAAITGFAGYRGWLVGLSSDMQSIATDPLFGPARFMCVWGIHLGGYVGGAIATAAAVIWIVRARRIASPAIAHRPATPVR